MQKLSFFFSVISSTFVATLVLWRDGLRKAFVEGPAKPVAPAEPTPAPRKRGRPRKVDAVAAPVAPAVEPVKRKRGRKPAAKR